MKKIIYGAVILLALVMMSPAVAQGPVISEAPDLNAEVPPEIAILSVKELQALDDQKLTEAFIDVLVEIDAVKMFHSTSGFTPKQYRSYKALLKYRLQLLLEVHRRKIELPAEIK